MTYAAPQLTVVAIYRASVTVRIIPIMIKLLLFYMRISFRKRSERMSFCRNIPPCFCVIWCGCTGQCFHDWTHHHDIWKRRLEQSTGALGRTTSVIIFPYTSSWSAKKAIYSPRKNFWLEASSTKSTSSSLSIWLFWDDNFEVARLFYAESISRRNSAEEGVDAVPWNLFFNAASYFIDQPDRDRVVGRHTATNRLLM